MTELSLHILDIVQNSIRARATTIEVGICENRDNNQYHITIKDNGMGMTMEQVKAASDPFYTTRTTRNVGLGIALLKQNSEQSEGTLTLNSEVGKGTTLSASFQHNHFDRPALGDIAGTMTLLMAANPKIHFIYTHVVDVQTFRFCSEEVAKELEGVPLKDPDIQKALKELIIENLKEIKATIN